MSISKDDMTDVRVFAPRRTYATNKTVDIAARDIKIVDINMPFFSMVIFFFKGLFAFVLALILFVFVQWLVLLLFGIPVLGGLMGFGL